MTSSNINHIFQQVSQIISPVYMVGGSVRDEVRSQIPKDYDFTTPLQPDDIEQRVRAAGKRPYVTGKRFGTIGFKVDGHMVEVTTFRSETYTKGSRKPRVEFVDTITHDLSRRDFTINAMAQKEDGSLVDSFGGQADLEAGIIRAVGKAHQRFNEDPLRMLRAARFAAQLGFKIDEDIMDQATKKAATILQISKERWVQELDKLLTADDPTPGLDFLVQTRLLVFMLPELAVQVGFDQDSPYHELGLWDHTRKTVRLAPNDVTLRWAALLHDVGKSFVKLKNKRGYSNYVHHELVGAELVSKIGPYLKWPNERTKQVQLLVRHHLEDESPIRFADNAAKNKK